MERILINANDDDNHAEDLFVHVSLTDCKILKITYKPSLKGGKWQINLYQI
jgi:major membrane immunogen (membrane-anchored lipoprotein)